MSARVAPVALPELPPPAPLARSTGAAGATRGYSIALAAALVLSTTGVLIRYLMVNYGLPALVLAFWRDLFAALTLLGGLAIFRPGLLAVERRHLPYLAGYGFVLALFNVFLTLSVAMNGAAAATVLVYSSAAFTALLGRWLLRESLGWAKLLAVAVSLGGCLLVSGATSRAAWQANTVGILTGVLSGLGYAGYSLMGRSASQRGLAPFTTLLYIFAFATGFLLAFNLLPGHPLPGSAARPADLLWLGRSASGWAVLYALAAGPTLVGFGLYIVSLVYLPSSVANLAAMTETAFTAVSAYLFLGEALTASQLAGAATVLAGVVFLRVREARWSRG